jgi:hypothetical protein
MNAVSGTRRAIKELVDGTIRLSVDISPVDRKAFFDLFPDIDMPIALAPLVDDFDRRTVEIQPEPGVVEPDPMTDRPKGGPLAKLAGILCADPAFQEWLAKEYESLWNVAVRLTGEDGADGEFVAAWVVRHICDVESRAMLDHSSDAAECFHDKIRKPWTESQ